MIDSHYATVIVGLTEAKWKLPKKITLLGSSYTVLPVVSVGGGCIFVAGGRIWGGV